MAPPRGRVLAVLALCGCIHPPGTRAWTLGRAAWPSRPARVAVPRVSRVDSPATAEEPGESAGLPRRTVQVPLPGNRAYPIYIGHGLLTDASSTGGADVLREHVRSTRVLVVTNDRVAPLYLDACLAAVAAPGRTVEAVVLPDGEQHKTMANVEVILNRALESRMDRKATFIALGGGVIGDMVGFAAAIYQRGVDFVQVPTTLMAMVDSSVGGKTGVNHPLGKNMIGAFHQPNCVIIDTATLDTLPNRELASGVAEIIKYGLIRDATFFQWQERNMEAILARDREALCYAIEQSCVNKVGGPRPGKVQPLLTLRSRKGSA